MPKLVIDPGEFTLGQIEEVEKLTDKGTNQTLAIVWIFMKAENPSATLDDARAVKQKDIEIVESTPDADPNSRTA